MTLITIITINIFSRVFLYHNEYGNIVVYRNNVKKCLGIIIKMVLRTCGYGLSDKTMFKRQLNDFRIITNQSFYKLIYKSIIVCATI